ncbi:unnamed protein product, partial [Closterium sp. NIES-54]
MGSLLSRLLGSRPMASAGPTMVVKDLVLIGGGHSHVVVLKSFAMKPMPGVRLILVTRDVHTPYSGMLPGLVAGHYTYDDCHIDLRPLAQLTNARLLHCCASALDLDQRAVVLADGRPPIRYDVLSIDIGITPLVTTLNSLEPHYTRWLIVGPAALLRLWAGLGAACCASAALLRHWFGAASCGAGGWAGRPPIRYDVPSIDVGITPLVCRHLTHWYHPNGMLSPHALVSPQWYAVTSRTGITPM